MLHSFYTDFYTVGLTLLSCSVVWNCLLGTSVFCTLWYTSRWCLVKLSPLLFAIYIDDLILKLRHSGFGLHMGSLFVGCVLYADSCLGLQKLVDICFDYGLQWDIKFNSKKSSASNFWRCIPSCSY